MKVRDDLLRDLHLEEMQRFLLVAVPQKRTCANCGKETWRPRYCSQHDTRREFQTRRSDGSP